MHINHEELGIKKHQKCIPTRNKQMKFYAYSLVLPIAMFTQAFVAPKPQTVIHCKFSLTRIVSLTILS